MHPNLLHFGPLILPTFGVLAAIGIMLALALSLRTAKLVGLSQDALWNAGLFLVAAAFILSRLLLVVEYLHSFLTYPILLLSVPSLTPLGILLTAIATAFYLRRRRLPLLRSLDAWAPCATLIWAFLALAHFVEGSDPGLPTHLPWGIAMPPDATPLHPVGIYAAIIALLLTAGLFVHLLQQHPSGQTRGQIPGQTAAAALVSTGLAQFLLTFLRQPSPYTVPLGNLLDPIQWLALAMLFAAALLHLQPRKPEPLHAL